MAKSSPNRRRRSKPQAENAAAAPPGAVDVLERIATALERLAPQRATAARSSTPPTPSSGTRTDGWRRSPHVNRVEMSLLKGIDRVRDMLVENTERFAKGLPANNALLWGARGMGKSSLVKATHAGVNAAVARNSKSAAP